jgi:hypothetical protein
MYVNPTGFYVLCVVVVVLVIVVILLVRDLRSAKTELGRALSSPTVIKASLLGRLDHFCPHWKEVMAQVEKMGMSFFIHLDRFDDSVWYSVAEDEDGTGRIDVATTVADEVLNRLIAFYAEHSEAVLDLHVKTVLDLRGSPVFLALDAKGDFLRGLFILPEGGDGSLGIDLGPQLDCLRKLVGTTRWRAVTPTVMP